MEHTITFSFEEAENDIPSEFKKTVECPDIFIGLLTDLMRQELYGYYNIMIVDSKTGYGKVLS